MKAKDVKVGAVYSVRVSGVMARVRIVEESTLGGWWGVDEGTGRRIRLKSARRLQQYLEG
jgi:hypothetical protein